MDRIEPGLGGDLIEPQRRGSWAVVPAPAPRPWPVSLRPLAVIVAGAGRLFDLAGFLETTSSTALVVVAGGAVVHEWYAPGVTGRDRLLGNSATKSALALLAGQAAAAGRLPDLDTPVTALVPELADSGYARVTLGQVLTMTSGTGWREDYHDPDSPASVLLRRYRSGEGGLREALCVIPAGDPPGQRYAYCTPDSLVLDWVRERATGESFAAALSGLWAAIGAEQPAVVGLDAPAPGGVAMAGGALAASARDWARIGWLQIDGGWAGQQLVGRDWIDASSAPQRPFLLPGRLPSTITTHAGFGYHWWPLDDAGERVMADGMRGQFVYVDRVRRVVVVKTSAWPYSDPWWDRQCRDLCYLALPAIAEAAAAS
ncbi:MAG TPA: serine hydrolase domain-containing protein [Streptosporangiaceae bacterium]